MKFVYDVADMLCFTTMSKVFG